MRATGNIGVGTILSEASDIASRHWPVVLMFALGDAALLLVIDLLTALASKGNSSGLSSPGNIGGVVIAYFLTVKLLAGEGILREEPKPSRLVAYFGVSFVSGLAIILGLIALVVPGLILAVRWYLAPIFAITERKGIGEALAASRDATAGSRWTLFGLQVLWLLAVMVPIMVITFAVGELATNAAAVAPTLLNSPIAFAGALATDLVGGGADMAQVVLAIASYRLLVGAPNELTHIFA